VDNKNDGVVGLESSSTNGEGYLDRASAGPKETQTIDQRLTDILAQ
jgi:hypothetical protein